MAKRRRRRRRLRARRARRPKYRLGDAVRISRVSVAWTLPKYEVEVGAGVHLVVRTSFASSKPGYEKGGFCVGCAPHKYIPVTVGSRARSRVDCMACIANHPDKV